MKYSLDYALSLNSDISPVEKEKVMAAVWKDMETIGAVYRDRVDRYSALALDEPLKLLDGFDYAIVGVTEYPRQNIVYDYWKCVEVYVIRDKMSEDDAMDKLDLLIENLDQEEDPVVMQPLDLEFSDEDDDDIEFEIRQRPLPPHLKD